MRAASQPPRAEGICCSPILPKLSSELILVIPGGRASRYVAVFVLKTAGARKSEAPKINRRT